MSKRKQILFEKFQHHLLNRLCFPHWIFFFKVILFIVLKKMETLTCNSTKWCIHWLSPVCGLSRDHTHNLGVSGQHSNYLGYPARALMEFSGNPCQIPKDHRTLTYSIGLCVLMPVRHLDYSNSVVNCEIQKCTSSNIIIFQDYFGYSGSLIFPYEF